MKKNENYLVECANTYMNEPITESLDDGKELNNLLKYDDDILVKAFMSMAKNSIGQLYPNNYIQKTFGNEEYMKNLVRALRDNEIDYIPGINQNHQLTFMDMVANNANKISNSGIAK